MKRITNGTTSIRNIFVELCGEGYPRYEKLPRNKWYDRAHNQTRNNSNGETKEETNAPISKTKEYKHHFYFMKY